jgi:hypothetical protein
MQATPSLPNLAFDPFQLFHAPRSFRYNREVIPNQGICLETQPTLSI